MGQHSLLTRIACLIASCPQSCFTSFSHSNRFVRAFTISRHTIVNLCQAIFIMMWLSGTVRTTLTSLSPGVAIACNIKRIFVQDNTSYKDIILYIYIYIYKLTYRNLTVQQLKILQFFSELCREIGLKILNYILFYKRV